MPSGALLLHDAGGLAVLEHFSSADDPDGWSWSSARSDPVTGVALGRLHLRTDPAGVTRRLHVEHGRWVLRGGCVGDSVLWRRGQAEHEAVADGFWGTSPAYALAAVRRLGLSVGERGRLRLVAVLEPALAPRTVSTQWRRTSEQVWEVDDLGTGERRWLRLENGVVVAGTGLTLTDS